MLRMLKQRVASATIQNSSSTSSSNTRKRSKSLMWENEHDLFQAFEVEHESCLDLEVEVTKGEGITKGGYIEDLCDTPDPYVVLKVPGSSNSSKRTSHVANSQNPMWNETFHFYLEPKKHYVLSIVLMDSNTIMKDQIIGKNVLELTSLSLDTPVMHIVQFTGGPKVHLTMKLQKNKSPDLRFSLALCEEEKQFMRLRREKVMQNMQKMFGEKGPMNKEEVPVVAVLGSGGGFRAMIGLSGVIKALHQNHILECITYISGLSGSSWLISSLYSHDKFPNLTYDEVYEELLKSVTHNWKWNLVHFHRYCLDMIKKYQGGQPVSFTDIFGHLLGDLLLHGRKDKKLSDQQKIVRQGIVPLPLYPCLHVKASVSCKAFSEWVEFSPFEIGIAKYGTFMKTEDFGSKFIVGKLVKKYPEFPLHYLQGVWGSAYTILIKRMVCGGKKEDTIEMMRKERDERELNERLEKEYLRQNSDDSSVEGDSGTDDESEIPGAECEVEGEIGDKITSDLLYISLLTTNLHQNDSQDETADSTISKTTETHSKSSSTSTDNIGSKEHSENVNTNLPLKNRLFNFPFKHKGTEKENTPEERRSLESLAEKEKRKSQRNVSSLEQFAKQTSHMFMRSISHDVARDTKLDNSVGKQCLKSQEKSNVSKFREMKSSIIEELLKNLNLMNSRAGRAGEILNPFRGLSLRQSLPLSPFSAATCESKENSNETEDMDFDPRCRYEPLDNTAKKLFVVDSGLAFNSPYPLLLRPQRAVDIYVSFDFSQRPSDLDMPFKELILAEKWANLNKVPFPPVAKQAAEFSKLKYVKEFYIFKDESDPYCPVILHFTIVNNKFKWQKEPGVRRVTKEEFEFADFSLFDDENKPFSSTNLVYEPLNYERLVKLMEFNTLSGLDVIKEEFVKMIEVKRKLAFHSVERTFQKIQTVLRACKMFKMNNSIKVESLEGDGAILMDKLRFNTNLLTTPAPTDIEGRLSSFFDARECQESHEEENEDSEYETDEG